MTERIIREYRPSENMPKKKTVKCSSYARRSRKRFPSLTTMRRKWLGLISYLTAGEPEVRAWTIKKGTKAPQAAGKIHSDFERGFIRAEVVSYDDLIACGSHTAAKEKGLIRLEGKDYVVQDGDIMLFRFNV